jgi:hypothetical protein
VADQKTIGGPAAAMIYLAESLADVKNETRNMVTEQKATNDLLRELVELARGQGSNQVEIAEDDFVAFMKDQEAKAANGHNGSTGK